MTKCLARSAINGLTGSKKLLFEGYLFFQQCARLREVSAEFNGEGSGRIALVGAIAIDHRQYPGVSPVKAVSRIEPRTCGKQGLLWPFPQGRVQNTFLAMRI